MDSKFFEQLDWPLGKDPLTSAIVLQVDGEDALELVPGEHTRSHLFCCLRP
jgi:hypothetical protein